MDTEEARFKIDVQARLAQDMAEHIDSRMRFGTKWLSLTEETDEGGEG